MGKISDEIRFSSEKILKVIYLCYIGLCAAVTLSWYMNAPNLATAFSCACSSLICFIACIPQTLSFNSRAGKPHSCEDVIALQQQPKALPWGLHILPKHLQIWCPRTRRKQQEEEGTKKLPLLFYVPLPTSLSVFLFHFLYPKPAKQKENACSFH